MKRSSKAAVCAALVGAAAGAHADVTLYGKVDLGFVEETGGPKGNVARLSSGVYAPSRFGIKADEDLGGGVKVKGQLETGLCADSTNNPEGAYCTGGNFMGRVAKLALAGGFGELSLGRQYTPAFLVQDSFDPFGTGLAGQAANLFGYAGLRANNAVIYTTPTFGGFNASGMVAFGETAGDLRANRQLGAAANYTLGGLAIGAGYEERRDAADAALRDANFGVSYDFGPVALYGLADRRTGQQDWLLGATAPLGGGTLMASVVRAQDRTGAHANATQFGVGYLRPLGKQLKAYAAYAHIAERSGAGYVVGNSTDTGTGTGAWNLGCVLSF